MSSSCCSDLLEEHIGLFDGFLVHWSYLFWDDWWSSSLYRSPTRSLIFVTFFETRHHDVFLKTSSITNKFSQRSLKKMVDWPFPKKPKILSSHSCASPSGSFPSPLFLIPGAEGSSTFMNSKDIPFLKVLVFPKTSLNKRIRFYLGRNPMYVPSFCSGTL